MLLNHQRSAADAISVTTSLEPVAVRMGNTVLAESRGVAILHEPGYPPRYYFPRLDVKMDLFAPSTKTTTCPHKGKAEYFHLKTGNPEGQNIAWSYPSPFLAVAEISGFISFYDDAPGITIG